MTPELLAILNEAGNHKTHCECPACKQWEKALREGLLEEYDFVEGIGYVPEKGDKP